MKLFLVTVLVLSAFASSSFAIFTGPKTYSFKFRDLESNKQLFKKTIPAKNQEEALSKATMECFQDLRAQNKDGQYAIDVCVNPTEG